MFFALRKARGEEAAFLDVDYSFDDIDNPMIMWRREQPPAGFMDAFQFCFNPGRIEDSLANGVSWYILSPRVLGVLKTASNSADLIVVPLPPRSQGLHPRLTDYAAVGVRRQLECLDHKKSDVSWAEEGKHADDVFDGVIAADKVPDDVDIFLLKEWPVVPIIRNSIAQQLQQLEVTGFLFQPFRISGQ
jgi:hypothetical protein